MLDQSERIANGMRAGGTGRRRSGVRPFGAVFDGYVAAGQIDNHRGDKKRGNTVGPALQQDLMFTFNDFKRANAAANVDTNLFGGLFICVWQFQFRAFNGKSAGRDGELYEAPHLLYFFFLDVKQRVEILHFAGDTAGKSRGIELRNRADSILALQNCRPYGLCSGAD